MPYVFSSQFLGNGAGILFGQFLSRMPGFSGQVGNAAGNPAQLLVSILNTVGVGAPGTFGLVGPYVNPFVLFPVTPVTPGGAPNWNKQVNFAGSDTQLSDFFGANDISANNVMIAGAPLAGPAAIGAAYVFNRSNPATGATDGWTQIQKLIGSDSIAGDEFGADVSIFGNTLVVTAPVNNGGRGAAYVFTLSGGVWTQVAKIAPADLAVSDSLAGCLLLGNNLFLSAINQAGNTGAVYWFQGSGAVWTLRQKLVGAAAGDFFGTSLAFDGVNLAIASAGAANGGKVGVYGLAVGIWTLRQTLIGSDTVPGDQFGTSVALNGNVVAVGARDHGPHGAAYVFINGIQSQNLVQPAPLGTDLYGSSISIGIGAPSWIAVGAPGRNGNIGAVYFFTGPALALDPTVTLTFKGEKVYP